MRDRPICQYFLMDVAYLRYQDNIIVLCQTKPQLEHCKQQLMDVLIVGARDG